MRWVKTATCTSPEPVSRAVRCHRAIAACNSSWFSSPCDLRVSTAEPCAPVSTRGGVERARMGPVRWRRESAHIVTPKGLKHRWGHVMRNAPQLPDHLRQCGLRRLGLHSRGRRRRWHGRAQQRALRRQERRPHARAAAAAEPRRGRQAPRRQRRGAKHRGSSSHQHRGSRPRERFLRKPSPGVAVPMASKPRASSTGTMLRCARRRGYFRTNGAPASPTPTAAGPLEPSHGGARRAQQPRGARTSG
jgi:hypothetical protein